MEVLLNPFSSDSQKCLSFDLLRTSIADGLPVDLDGNGKIEVVVASYFGVIIFEFSDAGVPERRAGLPFPKAAGPDRVVALASGDWDNDADTDLLGLVDWSFGGSAVVLWENDGAGNFEMTYHEGFGSDIPGELAVADIDLDGALDVVLADGAGTVDASLGAGAGYTLWRGTAQGSWLELDLVDPWNLGGLGATVTVEAGGITQTKGQYAGVHGHVQDFARLHFGLGDETDASVTVVWTDGRTERFADVKAGQIHRLEYGAGQ